MPWSRLKFTPGFNKEGTRYSASGTWWDGNLVRFRDGYPESWGGWQRVFATLTSEGYARSLHRFSDLSGFQWTGIGTNRRFYIASDDVYYDITPYRSSTTLAANPLDATNGSTSINVNHTAHGLLPGDSIIISGATTFAGIPASDFNKEHVVVTYVGPDDYTINVATTAGATVSGGGGAVVVNALYHAGSTDQIYGGGWGTGGWGEEEWGGDPTLGSASRLGIWTQENWGEDLVANVNKGPIFYWDATNPSTRMVNIRNLPGADGNAPEYSEFVLVSHRDRHLLSFGCTEFGSSNVNPMTVRWCSQENILNWNEASTTGTAGSLPLSRGSRLLAGIATLQEIVIWSDAATYSLRYIGSPYIYGAEIIADFSDIVGLKACTQHNSVVYWMGRSGFYAYTGRVERIPCSVWDYVSNRMDVTQNNKVFGSTNRAFNEIIWFYPSTSASPGEVDSYVSLNITSGAWTTGALPRTAWLDMDTLNNPVAASTDLKFYAHEFGAVDGSTSPASAINAYVESGPIELSSEGAYDRGDRMLFIRRIFPDVTFRSAPNLDAANPRVNLVLETMDKPGGGLDDSTSSQVTRSVILPVEEFTDDLHVRIRGRSVSLKIQGGTAGTLWRLGIPRIDIRTDGQR